MRSVAMSNGRLFLKIIEFQSLASVSMPKTATTRPVEGSVTGINPLTHVPQRSVYGPSFAISPVANADLTAAGASEYTWPGGE